MTKYQVKHCTNTEKSKSQEKWQAVFPEMNLQWKAIYMKVFDTCKDNKLQNFQYNFIHRLIATNKYVYLLKCKYAPSSLCTFCNMAVESIDHLFWECHLIQPFWNNLFDMLVHLNLDVMRSKLDVFLYTENKILSYVYTLAKFYIYNPSLRMSYRILIPSKSNFATAKP